MTTAARRSACLALLALVLVAPGCASSPPHAGPDAAPREDVAFAAARPTSEHVWLEQLLGTWEVTGSADMGPDAPPMEMTAIETVRPVGDLWIQSELSGDHDGVPMTALMTLGFDPEAGHFAGTWIDSSQTTLWVYEGRLDEAGTTLELFVDGPDFADPGVTRTYRDAVTIIAPGHRRMTSSVQADDGTWTTFMTAEARRVAR